MTPQNESLKQSQLDEMLAQSERELHEKNSDREKKAAGEIQEETTISSSQTQTALEIERDILASELDSTQKLEKGLWICAHIVCLPFFYDEYTIRAKLPSDLQKKYNQAIITTCGRFKVMGKKGIALVSPIASYIRNYADFSSNDRKELEDILVERAYEWLASETSLDSQPQMEASHSLQTIMKDVERAEQVFANMSNNKDYMEGEVRLAVFQAIKHSDFLPPLVKYKLLEDLKTLDKGQIYDIGTFLLWEIRKSSSHHNKLLYYMLRIFKRLSDSMISRMK